MRARIADPSAIDLPDEEADALLADALLELGGRSVHLAEGAWTTCLPEGVDLPDTPTDVVDLLTRASGLPGISVELTWQDHADWAEVWKAGLEPRRLTDRLIVTPSWRTPDAGPGEIVIVLDPGMAFGNAEHGTTRGCLRLLDGVVREGVSVLDIGAGSGVLSIACARLGATRCLAVEGDELAIETARENARRNGVSAEVEVVHRRVDAEGIERLGAEVGGYDGVACNIEMHLLTPLLSGLVAAVRPGGWLLLSGILETQWAEIEAILPAMGWGIEEIDADGEWRSGIFRRR
ncbi:MAG: 50S ribosomal protein L11 methyltransferase [Longimicrobiales bacterium]|nr:50S ribosomal protein L11 methyltransferase [Longimicrobiales bacterium]